MNKPISGIHTLMDYYPTPDASSRSQIVEIWLDQNIEEQRRARIKEKRATARKEREMEKDVQRRAQEFDPRSFLRVVSLNLCCAIFGFNIVMSVLTRASPKGRSRLDGDLNWVISVPVAVLAFLWETSRFSIRWRRLLVRSDHIWDAAGEAVLSVLAAICTILAAFQAAQHNLHNANSPNEIYQHIGPEASVTAMLGLLTISSLGLKTLAVMSLFKGKSGPRRMGEKPSIDSMA